MGGFQLLGRELDKGKQCSSCIQDGCSMYSEYEEDWLLKILLVLLSLS